MGPPRLYYHYQNQVPKKPPGGWHKATTKEDPDNNVLNHLKQGLLDDTISWRSAPNTVYNAHQQFWCIAPKKWPVFFKAVVKSVLGIDIDHEKEQEKRKNQEHYVTNRYQLNNKISYLT